jgi:anti-sigma regulatory factor (Ser/Thr protein kinase)
LIATTTGLMRYKKNSAIVETLGGKWEGKIICTDLFQEKDGDIWFSTLQHGIGFYDAALQQYSFYGNNEKIFSINTLCKKSAHEFVVAITDSLPAVFNTIDHGFTFINDTIFNYSRNHTTDIKMDGFGNLFVVKGGDLYYTRSFSSAKMFSEVNADSAVYAPFIYEMLINRRPYFEWVKNGGMLPNRKEITLRYNENQLEFSCSLHEFWDQRNTKMAWKMDGMNMDWVDLPPGGPDKFKAKHIPPLPPGKYVFRVKAKTGNEDWRKQEASLIINISLPFWQTWWFWTIAVIVLLSLIISFYRRHIFSVRKKEREKVIHEKELLELEAKALRAQMNPHFVFNSMNAIKSLINKNENDAAANYLTTFSKLIRTLFQNSDKREVSLFEELETCRFYTQLEKMRFGDKVQFIFDIDETIDLKDFKVPALILQPFIENAIWHGIMPKESGGNVTISVKQIDNAIQCIIEDDGIGRVLSQKYKAEYETTHQSKGIGLTQSRLELDKLLNEREDAIEIIDKTEASGRPAGTRVIITFKEE